MNHSVAFVPKSYKLINDIVIPHFMGASLRHPSEPECKDVRQTVLSKVTASPRLKALPKGARVAVGVGSRGIAQLPVLVCATVDALRNMGLSPFIVPSMGSHGGATTQGQTDLLAHLGISEATMSAPVMADMETVNLGEVAHGVQCHMARTALEADATVVVARVKPHTNFTSTIESGLCKMLAVGLGKDMGAKNVHIYGRKGLVDYTPMLARYMIDHANIAFGLAVLENADNRLCHIEGVETCDFMETDKRLLSRAKSMKSILPFEQLDLLVVESVGKNISGTGMDSKVVGRTGFGDPYIHPYINTVVALRVTPESSGNGIGVGIADITTVDTLNKLDLEAMHINALTSCCMDRAKLPPGFASEKEAIQAGCKICWQPDPQQVRAAVIRSTLDLVHVLLTPPLAKEVQRTRPELHLDFWQDLEPLPFEEGHLRVPWPALGA